jgi:hypothetical protein
VGVIVSVDRDTYASGDTVVTSIRNDFNSLITAMDQQSFCWIARIEREGPDGWERADVCPSLAPPTEEHLDAGESRVLRLPVALETNAYPALVHAGTYRWKFVYSVGDGFSFERAQDAVSAAFVVQ